MTTAERLKKVETSLAELNIRMAGGRNIFLPNIKSGATQAAAGAAANELWKTNGHDTLPDNVILIGI